MKLAVIGLNQQTIKFWIRDHKLNEIERLEMTPISTFDMVRGRRFDYFVTTYRFYENTESVRALEYLQGTGVKELRDLNDLKGGQQ